MTDDFDEGKCTTQIESKPKKERPVGSTSYVYSPRKVLVISASCLGVVGRVQNLIVARGVKSIAKFIACPISGQLFI